MKRTVAALTFFVCGFSSCLSNKENNTPDPILHILQQRHSGYSYDSSRPVTTDQLKLIMQAGQLAPSSSNDQPWYFIICDRITNPEAYKKAHSILVPFNQKWTQNAPVLVVVIASTNSHKNNFNRWAQYDTGAAAFSMMLQATSLGLMAHQMGGFDAQKTTEVFEIPASFMPIAMMAIGYAAADEKKPEKKRKPLNENFFMGSWGVPS